MLRLLPNPGTKSRWLTRTFFSAKKKGDLLCMTESCKQDAFVQIKNNVQGDFITENAISMPNNKFQ
jgi:hypothetical protein